MKINRSINNFVRIDELMLILAVYILYTVMITLTASDLTDSAYSSFTYFVFVNFILLPCYLFFIGRHDTYVTSFYCYNRFKTPVNAFLTRICYLLIENILFIFPYIVLIFIFAMASDVNVTAIGLLLCGLNAALSFLMVGIVSCFISVKWRIDYLGFFVCYLILCVDYLLTSGMLMVDFSFYYVPMLEVFIFSDTLMILKSVLFSFIKVVVAFGVTYSVFKIKVKNVKECINTK